MSHSLYENNHPKRVELSNGICFGRITAVYPEERMCEVKTFLGPGNLSDQHIPKAQWLTTDGHPDGDESGAIPRVNSYCLVFFVCGQPFVWGFLRPLNKDGSGAVKADSLTEELFDGDRILKTVNGNKIILRAHGEIQIEASNICRTIYFPDEQLINTLCKNYEFRTDGGSEDWKLLDIDDGTTNNTKEYRRDTDRTAIIVEEKGTMEDGTEFLYRKQIGVGGEPEIEKITYTQTIKDDGETETFIRAVDETAGFKSNIKPTGETEINIADKTKLSIKPTGEVNLDVAGKATINIQPNGETKIDIGPGKNTITIQPDGTLKIDATSKVDLTTPTINLSASKVNIGSMPAMSAVLGELLKVHIDTHIHATAVGPSGPPLIQMPPNVLSQTVKVQP